MINKNKDTRPKMIWVVMDITDMSEFDTDSFDLVIDKGTIDSLICGEDYLLTVAKMLKETQRVLKTGGHYFAISYGEPESRACHLVRSFLSWERKEFILDDSSVDKEGKDKKSHYIYVCKKSDDANEMSEKNFASEYLNLEIENE